MESETLVSLGLLVFEFLNRCLNFSLFFFKYLLGFMAEDHAYVRLKAKLMKTV